jgi:O-antigen ligase
MTYLARRSGLATFLGFIFTGYFLNLLSSSRSKVFRYLPLIIVIFLLVLFSQHFEYYKEAFFQKLSSRISEDTRTAVFERFFYFLKDKVLFGTGLNGTYYCPLWDVEIDGVTFGAIEYRNIIENGYLQLYLTGGIVHVILYVLVLLPASIIGIFRSSNQFVKACGVLIFLRLIDMLMYGVPSLSLSYILVWICVGVCYKSSVRNLTNDEVRNEFNKIAAL